MSPPAIMAANERRRLTRKARAEFIGSRTMLTTGAMFAGFYAIVAAIDLRFEYAGIAVFVAMIFDGTRWTSGSMDSTASSFGKEYDSLSDMVSFGVAPAIVTYQWGCGAHRRVRPVWRREWAGSCVFSTPPQRPCASHDSIHARPFRTNTTSRDCRVRRLPRSSRHWYGWPAIKRILDCRD